MGHLQDKYTRMYYTGTNETGNPVGYGANAAFDDSGAFKLRDHDTIILDQIVFHEKRVLDIGAGRGEAIAYALDHGARYCSGVDFAAPACELANELLAGYDTAKYSITQAESLSFLRELNEAVKNQLIDKFDIVIMLDFIEHVPRSEMRKVLDELLPLLSALAIVVVNTPCYRFDNDVIADGLDQRNLIECYDTSDSVPETAGMHCNKFSMISLQKFMREQGFTNLTESHFFVPENSIPANIMRKSYASRWRAAVEMGLPLRPEYRDDESEFPYPKTNVALHKFDSGNLNGIELYVSPDYANYAFPENSYDRELFDDFALLVNTGKTIFDVGGFMGVNALLFAKLCGNGGKVVVFEPNPYNCNRMYNNFSHNLAISNVIEVYPLALGNVVADSEMVMSASLDNGHSSTSRLKNVHPALRESDLPGTFFSETVKQTTLDAFVEESGLIPDVIKIDIEGAEHLFMEGGLNTLRRHMPVLYIELHTQFCAVQCAYRLFSLGYAISTIHEESDFRLIIKASPTLRTENTQESYVSRMLELYRKNASDELCNYSALQKVFCAMYAQQQKNAAVAEYDVIEKQIKLENDKHSFTLQKQNLNSVIAKIELEKHKLAAQIDNASITIQTLNSQLEKLQREYDELNLKHAAMLASKAVRVSNKIKKIIGKPLSE